MKNKKLAVLLSALVIATAPAAVLVTACQDTPEPTPPPVDQTTEYTFSFVGGTGATGTAPASIKKNSEESFTLPTNTFTKEGYTFDGWSDGTATTPYAAGATYKAGTANVQFTAVWKAVDYKVSFEGGEGATGTVAEITGKHIGDKVTLPANAFEKDDHTFAGWKVGEETKQAGDEITIGSADVAVTAVWTQNTYSVTFVGGEGATGTVAAITGHNGDEVTLPENAFEKAGYDFIGWKVGEETKQAGDKITLGKADVTVTAVWDVIVVLEGEYVDNIPESDITATFADGKVTITSVGQKWDSSVGGMVPVTNTTEYNYSVNRRVVTFIDTEDETETYTGAIVEDVVVITVPVQGPYSLMDTSLALTKTALALIDDMGSNGYAQTASFQDYIYMFDNGLILGCEGYGREVVKYGTYTALGNHLYSVTFAGDDKSCDLKITINGTAFYTMSDGFGGKYTLGEGKVTLDGFGGWENGSYFAISDGTNTMVYLVDTEAITNSLYTLSDNTLTEITDAKAGIYTTKATYPAIEKIIYNGSNLAGLVYSDEGGNTFVAAITATVNTISTVEIDYAKFTVMYLSNGVFTVRNSSNTIYYTLNGAEVPTDPTPTTDLVEGDYADSITNGIGTASTQVSAKIENTTDGTILTLTRGTSSAYYQVTGEDGTYTFTQIKVSNNPTVATGYLVEVGTGEDTTSVLFISNIKAGSTSVVCALSSSALERIDNVSNGYVNNPLSTSLKLYLYKNGFAVYYTAYSAGKCGTYTVDGDIYTVTFADETTGEYKVTLDEGTVKAAYITKDAYAKTYTIGGKEYTFDGWGNYTTSDSVTGKYAAGSAGFTIVNADGTATPYTVENDVATVATEPIVGVVNGVTVHNVTAPSTATILRNNGLIFDNNVEVYVGTGCAKITYKVVTGEGEEEQIGENQTVLVALGATVEINGVTFTVTKVNDDGCVNLSFKDGTSTKNLTYDYAAG